MFVKQTSTYMRDNGANDFRRKRKRSEKASIYSAVAEEVGDVKQTLSVKRYTRRFKRA